jgi:hypothetical protein
LAYFQAEMPTPARSEESLMLPATVTVIRASLALGLLLTPAVAAPAKADDVTALAGPLAARVTTAFHKEVYDWQSRAYLRPLGNPAGTGTRDKLYRLAFEDVLGEARKRARQLTEMQPEKNPQRYTEALIKLAVIGLGYEKPSDLISTIDYMSNREFRRVNGRNPPNAVYTPVQELDGKNVLKPRVIVCERGLYAHPNQNDPNDPMREIVKDPQALFQYRLKLVIHELVHARQFARFCDDWRRQGKDDDWIVNLWAKTNAFPEIYAERELEAESTAERLIEILFNGIHKDVGLEANGYQRSWEGPLAKRNLARFADHKAKFESWCGSSAADAPEVAFDKAKKGPPAFGGIILGNRAAPNSVRCVQARFRVMGDRVALDLVVADGQGKQQRCVYDGGTVAEFWSAYHVLRPTADMREATGVRDSECNLVDLRSGGISLQATLHPALLISSVGERCVELEAVSGRLFLTPPGAQPANETGPGAIALQWYDAPARFTVADGRLSVRAADGGPADAGLLRLRLVGSRDDGRPRRLRSRKRTPSSARR